MQSDQDAHLVENTMCDAQLVSSVCPGFNARLSSPGFKHDCEKKKVDVHGSFGLALDV